MLQPVEEFANLVFFNLFLKSLLIISNDVNDDYLDLEQTFYC